MATAEKFPNNNLHINFPSDEQLNCLQILNTTTSDAKNVLKEFPVWTLRQLIYEEQNFWVLAMWILISLIIIHFCRMTIPV